MRDLINFKRAGQYFENPSERFPRLAYLGPGAGWDGVREDFENSQRSARPTRALGPWAQGPGPVRSGPMGPGPVGPGPMGPAPMGPGPMGPCVRSWAHGAGPGPMGPGPGPMGPF